MENITALAAAETIRVLYNTESSLIVKIPYIILKSLEDKAMEYAGEVIFNTNLALHEQAISEEAQSILSILYKDYWCDKEKHNEMNKIFEEKEKEYQQEQAELLDPFKNIKQKRINDEAITSAKNIQTQSSINTSLIAVPKKWYVRIFDRIMRFFRKK